MLTVSIEIIDRILVSVHLSNFTSCSNDPALTTTILMKPVSAQLWTQDLDSGKLQSTCWTLICSHIVTRFLNKTFKSASAPVIHL